MSGQLVSYIAPSAPATRRPATDDEPRVRPEIGFTPRWYRQALDIDFGERWHADPAYRRRTIILMREELRRCFPGTAIGGRDRPEGSLDILTGTRGVCAVAGVYGIPVRYAANDWPTCEKQYIDDRQVDALVGPDLDENPFFGNLMSQVDWIADREGLVVGFVNWPGVLNNAYRLRGEKLFLDMVESPQRALHVFGCVCTTMIEGAERLHARQEATGAVVHFFTVSNCLVNMVSPQRYCDLLLPFDIRIAEAFGCIGIHNCAWNADPYLEHYAAVPHVGYIDMGIESNLARAKRLFPRARRAVMYKPTDLAVKPMDEIRVDIERIAQEYAPCDIVFADIDIGVADERVRDVVRLCETLSSRRTGRR